MINEAENNMENFQIEFEGKAICHTYESLVGELASRMVVNEKVLLTNKKDKFDSEDIFSWIKAVDYKDTEKAPDVQAILSTKQGRETLTFDVRKEEAVKNKDEKVSKESLLYSMALTEAKMKVISAEAEEVYPALAFQIKDYRKTVEKMREEVLENKEEKRSLEDVLNRLTSRRVLPYATAAVVTILFLTSCGRNPGIEKTPTSVPTEPPAVEVTEMPTAAPEATATIEPIPTATEVVEVEKAMIEWDKMELNIGGRPMEFAIGTEEGVDLTNKWGMEKVEINDNLIDAEKKFSEMMGSSFWQIYVAQSGENITYEEYLANPEKFTINLSIPDGKGGYEITEFTIDQIKRFERKFVGSEDQRLSRNFQIPGDIMYSYGYKMTDDGTFIVYESFDDESRSKNVIFSPGFPLHGDPAFDYIAGDDIGQSFLYKLFDIGYVPDVTNTIDSTESPTESVESTDTSFIDFVKIVTEKGSLPNIDDMLKKEGDTSLENSARYFTDYGFWKVQTASVSTP